MKEIANRISDAVKTSKPEENKASSETITALAEYMKAIEELYPTTDSMVVGITQVEKQPDAELPALREISGADGCDADAQVIINLAAWDKWILESDQQLGFAVKKDIGRASKYQLAEGKYGNSGKALAQSQAEAVKLRHEYHPS
jgi:hypothetical protein